MKREEKGFTLIELLVVISIIALLASIIFATFSTVKSKANISAGLEFAANLNHSFGATALGVWNFNETPASPDVTISDATGNGLNLTSVWGNTYPFVRSTTNTVNGGRSLSVGGSATWASYSIPTPTITSSDYTLNLWVNITNSTGLSVIAGVGNTAADSYDVALLMPSNYTTSNTLKCFSNNVNGGSNVSIGGIFPNTWYNITCSINSSTNKMTAKKLPKRK